MIVYFILLSGCEDFCLSGEFHLYCAGLKLCSNLFYLFCHFELHLFHLSNLSGDRLFFTLH